MNTNKQVVIDLSTDSLWDYPSCPEAFRIVRILPDKCNTVHREKGDWQDYCEHSYCNRSYRFEVEVVHGPANDRKTGRIDCMIDLEDITPRTWVRIEYERTYLDSAPLLCCVLQFH